MAYMEHRRSVRGFWQRIQHIHVACMYKTSCKESTAVGGCTAPVQRGENVLPAHAQLHIALRQGMN